MRRIVLAAAFVLATAFVPGATAAQPAAQPARDTTATTDSAAVGILGSLGALFVAIRATSVVAKGLERIQASS